MKVFDASDLESLLPVFKGERGRKLADSVLRFLAIDKVNGVYQRSGHLRGAAFASGLLEDIGVDYGIGNPERLAELPGGAFITVSNHPYGGLDGIILIDLMAAIRKDYKFMVNQLLARIKTMGDNFIAVTPAGNDRKGISAASIAGLRETLTHIRNGHPVGFFPSGAVSDFSLKEMRVRDRDWQKGILNLIHSVKVPILPVRFFDRNSPFFYFLGLLHWKIRSLRMPGEVFNKRGQHPRLGIGTIITVEEQERYGDSNELGLHLRKAVYDMPLPAFFLPRSRFVPAGLPDTNPAG